MKKLRLVSVQNCIYSCSLGQQPPYSDFVECSLSVELESLGQALRKMIGISFDELMIVDTICLDNITGRICVPHLGDIAGNRIQYTQCQNIGPAFAD